MITKMQSSIAEITKHAMQYCILLTVLFSHYLWP